MGFTDSQGRPEIIAQPYVAKGLADARVAPSSRPGVDPDPEQPGSTSAGLAGSSPS